MKIKQTKVDKLILLERSKPLVYEVHIGKIVHSTNLLLSTYDKEFATRLVNGYNMLSSEKISEEIYSLPQGKFLDRARKQDLKDFVNLLNNLNILSINENEKFIQLVEDRLKYIKSDKEKRKELSILQELENRWYQSLERKPDFSVYDDTSYLADLWVCWKNYSRDYIKSIISDKTLSTIDSYGFHHNRKSIKDYMTEIQVIVDLGCGFGYTTAALKETFDECIVIGTNIKETKQYQVCKEIAKQSKFIIKENISQIGKADLIFASEYFEHLQRPIEHLIEILEKLKPKYILFANTFTTRSIGHFDTYIHNNKPYKGLEISKLFTKTLKGYKYQKVKTNCFNNRPNFYEYAG
jgi:2-polyprenyl-3-methyl-5-hydroxy-6-metoxy-1,4-benzoquinol methylase